MTKKNTKNQKQKQEINPGILSESDAKQKLVKELEKLIHQANFLPDESEKNWIALLPYFSEYFLDELKHTVIRENLRHLSIKNKVKH